MKEVYFVSNKKDLGKLWKALDMKFKEPIAIKTSFGEKGNVTYPDPRLVKFFAKKLKKPTLIESNVLYKGLRTKSSSHIKLAKKHGFDFAPIDICDGEEGNEETKIKVNLKHFKKVRIGKGIRKYNSILGIAHFKGHPAAGFGGAIKNIGMGLGSRAGKLAMHSSIAPDIDELRCRACGKCIEACPVNAITMKKFVKNYAFIDDKKCIGCAKCIAVCPYKAVKIPWSGVTSEDLQERMTEYTYGVLKGRKSAFINFLVKITPGCDCIGKKMKPIMKDIGYLASTDCVALDQACYNLVMKKYGGDPFARIHDIDGSHQLEYAEKIKLGSRKYKLVQL